LLHQAYNHDELYAQANACGKYQLNVQKYLSDDNFEPNRTAQDAKTVSVVYLFVDDLLNFISKGYACNTGMAQLRKADVLKAHKA
jgi:hypothetical protein